MQYVTRAFRLNLKFGGVFCTLFIMETRGAEVLLHLHRIKIVWLDICYPHYILSLRDSGCVTQAVYTFLIAQTTS